MTDFEKVPEKMRQAFDTAFGKTLLGSVLDGFGRLDKAKERDLAAFRGGIRDFESEAAVKEEYSRRRASTASDGRAYVAQIVGELRAAADDAMRIDAPRLASLAGLGAMPLSDDDVLRMARDGRGDYTLLLALAQLEGGASRRLRAALARCDDELSEFVEKAEAFASRSVAGQNDVRCASDLVDLVHRRAERLADAWGDLSATIEGAVPADPLATALIGATRG